MITAFCSAQCQCATPSQYKTRYLTFRPLFLIYRCYSSNSLQLMARRTLDTFRLLSKVTTSFTEKIRSGSQEIKWSQLAWCKWARQLNLIIDSMFRIGSVSQQISLHRLKTHSKKEKASTIKTSVKYKLGKIKILSMLTDNNSKQEKVFNICNLLIS